MKLKRSKIVRKLNEAELEEISASVIESYKSMGYEPYLDEKGGIKWLTEPQYNLRMAEGSSRFWDWLNPFKMVAKPKYRRRIRRSNFQKFIIANWFFLILLLAIILFVFIAYFRPGMIF